MERELNIAVFGDLHGHLRLMLQLCRLWQHKHGVYLDGVLQCGDIGYFPNITNIDKATRKFAMKNPEELGFAQYFCPPQPVELDEIAEATLGVNADGYDLLCCPIFCVNGNHEDFENLDRVSGGDDVVPLDYYEAFLWLKSGCTTEIGNMKIGGVGGGPETQSKKRHPLMYVQESDCTDLLGGGVDILVSHGGPMGIGGATDTFGSEHLRFLVECEQPAYNFYAHYGEPIPAASVGQTQCFWLDDVAFQKKWHNGQKMINPSCMGILKWQNKREHKFKIMDENWFEELSEQNWKVAPGG